jgi:hypothetical protein
MVYTNNIPQGNQQVATTQPLIQGNFEFIQTDLQVEHSFNGNVGGLTEGVHLKASMPNQADPVSLPAGTNGMYYVSGGQPKFYNGVASFIQFGNQQQNIISGVAALTAAGFSNVFTMPASSYGYYFIAPVADSLNVVGSSFIFSNTTALFGVGGGIVGANLGTTGLILKAQLISAANNGNYHYTLVYFTP